jgi:putative transposase
VPKHGDREASPTAAIIDSQYVNSAEKSQTCIDPNGYDAGKKIKGKKRHIRSIRRFAAPRDDDPFGRRSGSRWRQRPDHSKSFMVLQRPWIVEGTIAWLNRCRRLAKDCDPKALAFLRLASIRLMLRKLGNPT